MTNDKAPPPKSSAVRCARIAVGAVAFLLAFVGLPGPARARIYSLEELIALAKKHNPGLLAGGRATAAIEAQLSEAQRSWLPTGEFRSLLAPSPDIRCEPVEGFPPQPADVSARVWRQKNCYSTNVSDATLRFNGIFTRTELRFVQPLFTFGKISAGVEAAEAGVAASKSREQGTAAELELNIKRAYFGYRLAKNILDTLEEGMGYLSEAESRVQKALDDGSGDMTVTDKLRLQTVRAELESRVLEAERGAQLALFGITALIGPEAPRDIEIAPGDLEPVDVSERPLRQYAEMALISRPEVRALGHFVTAKRRLADFEWRRLLPDLVLVGTATFAYASSVDNPQNAFTNDPFNNLSAGLAAAINVPLDFGVKNARANRVAAEADEAILRQREALAGIEFEVAKAYGELTETRKRIEVLGKGERVSRRWITSIIQKMELGLAEAREITDALQGYFQMRLRYLQAVYDHNLAASALSRATGESVTR